MKKKHKAAAEEQSLSTSKKMKMQQSPVSKVEKMTTLSS